MAAGAERKIHIPVPRGLRSALLYTGLLVGGGGVVAGGGAYAAGFFDSDGPNQRNVQPPFVQNLGEPTPAATQVSTPTETSTAVPPQNRADCNTIRGTNYLSEDEDAWFRANCITPTVPSAQLNPIPASTRSPSVEIPKQPEIFVELRPNEEAALTSLINAERQKNGLNPVVENQSLKKAAEDYIVYLHNTSWVDNQCNTPCEIPNPHGRNGTPQSRAEVAGYQGTASEVLGFTEIRNPNFVPGPADWQTFVKFRIDGWLNSPPHKEIVLGSTWQEVGVGCIYEGNWYRPFFEKPIRFFLCVAMFGKR